MFLPNRIFVFAALLSSAGVAFPLVAAEPASNVGPKLDLHKWSGDINIPDPVACTVDPQGRVYVTQTTRRKVADLDIREHMQWVAADVALESVDEKRAFYHDVLAPGKMLRAEGSLKDHNKDGSIDWKDLTVHTERIYRLEDTDGDGIADKKTVFAEGFNTEVTGIAAGILWHDGWIYTTIAPDLWRLRDTNDDGIADERESIVHGFGNHIAYAGHDMHGLTVGPDGRIYWSIGDKGVNVKTKEGTIVKQPHQGAVLRCDPDGRNFEIFAHGLRNVQEIAFDDYGDLFGVDNDADKPGEKERLVYITEQSDSGWRCGYQYMKGFVPWVNEGLWQTRFEGQPEYITPPLAQGHDGPAGFAFNPGTALSGAWKNYFFTNQFPSGKMNGLRVEQDGASFKLTEDKVVASGVMGIGMSWHPNGKLFMADWGGGYPLNEIGAVWSLDDMAGAGSPERKETSRLLTAGFEKTPLAELVPLLGHADQRVRRGAQFSLVKRGEFMSLRDVALDVKKTQLARIHALWGLGQGMRAGKTEESASLLTALLKDQDFEIRAQLAKVIGDAASNVSVGDKLVPLLSDKNSRVRFQAAIALGKLKVASASDALLSAVAENADKDAFLRHALVTGLAGSTSSEKLAAISKHESRAVRLAAVLALRRQASPEIAVFLNDADQSIVAEAARGIHDDESVEKALPSLANVLGKSQTFEEGTTLRALNANFRLGQPENAKRVIQFALQKNAPLALRAEALTLIKLWSEPPPLDRVDGHARKLPARSASVIVEVAKLQIEALMALQEKELKSLAVPILTAYKLPVAASVTAAAAMDATAPGEVRAEVLLLLADQHEKSPELKQTLDAVLGDKKAPGPLRIAALDVLLKQNPDLAVQAAEKLILNGGNSEKQKAFAVLAAAKTSAGDQVLLAQMEAYTSGKIAPPLQLDLLEAVQNRSADVPALAAKLTAFEASRAAAAGTVTAFTECLEGGNVKNGREIALDNLVANCTACHRFSVLEGSNVGPVLDAIGKQKDRVYLLESLVNPGAAIAPGFGLINLTLKNGNAVSGSLVSSSDQNVQVRLADGTLQTVPTGEIAARTEPLSVMPPMGAMLTKRQIRDLVAYLASLQGPKPKPSAPAAGQH